MGDGTAAPKGVNSAELMEAVEQLLGSGSFRVEVVRRKAPERKQWTPRPTTSSDQEVA